MNEIYEVWVIVDSQPNSLDESVVAVFTTEEKLLEFTDAVKAFIESGRFLIQPKVSVNPNFAVSTSRNSNSVS